MTLGRIFFTVGFAAALFSFVTVSSRPAGAAADNTLGMAMFGAEVYAAGTLHSAVGVTYFEKSSTGTYLLGFERVIGDFCFVAATPLLAVGYATIQKHGDPYLHVQTFREDGAPFDLNFNVVVFCAK